MFMFLSHPLDPEGYAWPGEPVVKTTQCTDVSDDCPFCSFVSELPNHCGTHMDAPRHFVKDGLSINDLSIDYFCHTEVALLEIPKGPAEGIYKEDSTTSTRRRKCSPRLTRMWSPIFPPHFPRTAGRRSWSARRTCRRSCVTPASS